MQVKVNALREVQSPAFHFGDGSQSAGVEELPPSLRLGDAPQSALMASVLDKAFQGESRGHK
jgi:hypothetical protein